MDELEKDLLSSYTTLTESKTDSARLASSDEFKVLLKSNLRKKGVFEHPFSSLTICTLTSPDKAFRIFNWNIPLQDGTHRYEALILIPKEVKGEMMMDIAEMKQADTNLDRLETRSFKDNEWLGYLVYEIIDMKEDGTYLLLGWDGYDRISNRKIIDVLEIRSHSVRTGSPLFKDEKDLYKRIVFRYAEEVSMSLRYQAKEKRILFDHLAPKDPRLEGLFQFYGPDMSFNAYVYNKGKWILQEDVEFLRKRQEKDKDFNDPRRK